MSASVMLWPVYRFNNGMKQAVAVFFDWSTSVDFINHPQRFGAEQHDYYQGEPQYARPAAYTPFRFDIDPQTKRERVAA